MKSISKIFFASEIIIFLLAVLSIFIIQTSLIAAANAANMSCPPPKTLESRTSLKRLNAISPSSISGKKILFIEDADSFNNTDWDGFTDLGNLLINMGFEVW